MIADGLDIAVVALPHHLHFEAAMTALENGCHVMLEKPAALNLAECRAISGAARKSKRKVMVADLAYHLAGIVKARQIVASGRMGRFIMGSIINYRFYFTGDRPAWFLKKEKSGGGMLFNLGVHRMAVVRSVVPEEECVVKASVGFFRPDCEVEGNGMIFIGYPDGTAVTLEECGYLVLPGPELTSPPGGGYQPLYEELLSAIREDRDPWPGIAQGAKDVRVILAAYESARTGRQVKLTGPEWEI
jgi:predicted dehydrogenase